MNGLYRFQKSLKTISAFRLEMQIDTNKFVDEVDKEFLEEALTELFGTKVFVETFSGNERQEIREAIRQNNVNEYLRRHNPAIAEVQQQLYYYGFQGGHLLGTFQGGIHKDDIVKINKLLTTALGAPVSLIPQSQYQLDFESPATSQKKIKVMDIMTSIFIFATGYAMAVGHGAPGAEPLFAGGILAATYWGCMALMRWIFKLGR